MYIDNLEEIKSRLEPREVLAFIGYSKNNPTQSGKELRDFCPIHEGDNQRSLSINIDSKLCHCHSCGFKGDLIKLYSESKKIDFLAATQALSNHFGIHLKEKTNDKDLKTIGIDSLVDIWNKSSTEGSHPYFLKKKVESHPGLRFGKDMKGNYSIVVPFYNLNEELQTVQFINERGKFFLAGYQQKGAFFPLGLFQHDDIVYLVEGLATALTIWKALGKNIPVISFGSCTNMGTVVKALKEKYPNLTIIICLDKNDAAEKQAKNIDPKYKCSFRQPSFELFPEIEDLADFNDLVSKCNQPLEVVRKQLEIEFNLSSIIEEDRSKNEPTIIHEAPAISTKKATGNGCCQNAGEVLKKSRFLDKIKERIHENRYTGIVRLSGISTGFTKLDEVIDGLQGGHLILLAGRTAMGKTYVVLNMLKNIAIDQKIPAALYSLEMSNKQVFYRIISLCSGIPSKKIKRGEIDDQELAKVEEAIRQIENSPLFVTDDPTNSNLLTLHTNMKTGIESGESKIIFIDHIGLVSCGVDYRDNRATELGTITMNFKLMAKQYDVPIFCLAQLNREADGNQPPRLSQLRESGNLEQNSDIVMFIHRRDYYDPNDKPEQAKIIVGKNREGDIGEVNFEYKKETWLLNELSISELNTNNGKSVGKV